jgi:hypothetical protein
MTAPDPKTKRMPAGGTTTTGTLNRTKKSICCPVV